MSSPVVTVRGEARREAPPDLATVSVTVHSAADSAEAVRTDLAEASRVLATVVAERAAAVERSSTTGLHVSPVFGRRSGTKITGYRGTLSAQVVIKDLDALSSVVVALGSVPNAQVDGPWWSLRPDNDIHRSARLDAITDARRRAADYAAAFDRLLGDLVEVSDLESGLSGGRPEMMMARSFGAEAAGEPTFEFEPAVQTVTAQVTVRFELAPSY